MRVFVSSRASKDLLQIYSYLALHNPSAAEVVLRNIDGKFSQLSQFPFIGRERSNLAPGLRSAVVGRHLIFYAVEQDRIMILRVIDGRMDVDEEFKR